MIAKKNEQRGQGLVLDHETSYKKEIVAVGLSMAYIYGALALFSYNPQDSTFFHFSSKNESITNWAGALGAHIAAILFYLLGSGAYMFLLALAYPLYLLFRSKASFKTEWSRLVVLSFMVVLVATMCSLYNIDFFYEVAGGVVGTMAKQQLNFLIGQQASHVFVWGLFWMMLCAVFKVPLMPWIFAGIKACGRWVNGCGNWLLFLLRKNKNVQEIDQTAMLSTTGAMKIDECDMAFWDTVQFNGDKKEDKKLSEETLRSLAELSAYNTSRQIKILKTPFARLPNSVLTKNMLSFQLPSGKTLTELLSPAQDEPQHNQFHLPSGQLLAVPAVNQSQQQTQEHMKQRAQKVEEKLRSFGVNGSVMAIKPGPVVTMFEYKPDIDSKISKIISLEDDLSMALMAQSMRIIAPIPGKNVIGFEIANEERASVTLAQIVAQPLFEQTKAALPLILGVDIAGQPVVADLTSMPHILVGGATGSGKSVGLNVMVMSLLYRLTPEHLKLILIDPKRLEFTPYADIPHLLFPIITQPQKAASVLAWVVQEMEERYQVMAEMGVRSIHEYRKKVEEMASSDEQNNKPMPYIVVIIDELADLMMVAGKDVETHIVRIAQMARAAGIHLIVATQRPSVDVVTGLIKVNFPSRVAFRVSSKVDSRTILDAQGAEKLLGKGDMLFMHASSPELKRVHGAYVSDQEVEHVTNFLRMQASPSYLDLNEILVRVNQTDRQDFDDELYHQVCDFIKTMDEISISMLQRHYRIGFNRSARIIEKLEIDGFIAPAQGSKPRKVLR